MLAIDKDTEVSLTNTQTTDLQALLLSILGRARTGDGPAQQAAE
jgi:hypothetical protein